MDVVVVSARRSAIGRFGKTIKSITEDQSKIMKSEIDG